MKRLLIALLFGSLAYAIALASAASLGVTDTGLGAGTKVVAPCDTDGVTTAYQTAYTAGTGYTVSSVDVSGINVGAGGCNGKTIKVTVAKNDGTSPASSAGVAVAAASQNVTVPGSPDASIIQNVYIVIS